MKPLNLILTIVCILLSGYFYSQNEVKQKYIPKTENSKYVGKYNYKKAGKSDSAIVYDCFEIYEKNGKLFCKRDTKSAFYAVGSNVFTKHKVGHYDCDIISINEKAEKIVIKFLNTEYSYRFIKNSGGNYEIIILENTLVYEKR